MALSARTISSMKWRTAFVALALLAFFTYGPRLKKEREQNWEQYGENQFKFSFRVFIKCSFSGGRHLLTVDGSEEGSGQSEGRKFLIGTKLETEKNKLNL